jgi:starch synthase
MKVVLVSAEAYPFSKTGGLGDVVGALFKELIKSGIDVTLFLPYYRVTKNSFHDKVANTDIVYGVPLGESKKYGALLSAKATVDSENNLLLQPDKGGNIFFIEHNDFFDREHIYGTNHGEYLDNGERFIFFSRAFLEICKILDFNFDIVHCHDWHTALIPLYLKTLYKECSCLAMTKTILTIHNLGYQGVFPGEKLTLTGFGWEMFHIDCLEFYGMINFLKGGIFNADFITTVSPTYAQEILTAEYGWGLDGVLRKRNDRLTGILNGVDYKIWNPMFDHYIVQNYGIDSIHEKNKNKEALIKMTALDYSVNDPLLAFIGRMVSQKGIELIIDSLSTLIDKGVRFIFAGTGEIFYENKIREIQKKFPSRVHAFIAFDEFLAHKIYAGIDGIILPSKYEPCGLSQMIAMRYGTIPICRKTGGCIDTVEDEITGFLFERFEPPSLIQAVERFIETYRNKEKFNKMIISAMKKDFSWSKTCKDYINLYEKVKNL